jgi:hypothetical protein
MTIRVETSGPIPAIAVNCEITGKKASCEITKPNKEKVPVDNVDIYSANKHHDTSITLKNGMIYEHFDTPRDCSVKNVAGSTRKSIDCDVH